MDNLTNTPSPIAFECPTCAGQTDKLSGVVAGIAGKPCRRPSGESMGKTFHKTRVALAVPTPADPEQLVREVAADYDPEGPRQSELEPADAAQAMRDTSICVIITLGRFTVRRTVAKADVNVEASEKSEKEIDQDAITVAKDLLDSEALRAIVTFDHYTKMWFKARSVPSPLLRSSAYMFKVDALAAMYDYLEARRKDRQALEAKFFEDYPELIKAARAKLGPLFDASEYPRADELKRAFKFTWQVVEIGTPDAKLRRVSQQIFEKEKAKAEQIWTSAVGQIEDALTVAMQDVVVHLAERLGGGDEKPKRFRESALKRVTDFLDAFSQRNIGGSAQLTGLVDKAKQLVSGVDVKALREDDGTRKRVVAGFAEIKGSLDKMMEARPGRAAVAFNDEV